MGSVKDEAANYTPRSSKTVAELDKFDISLQMFDDAFDNEDGTKNNFKAVEVEGVRYRVPFTVLSTIKELLKVKPELKFVKVIKSGEGRTGTKYTTIPFD